MNIMKKVILTNIKSYLTDDFDKWELWVYCFLLPMGFGLSILLGYLIGLMQK